MSADIPSRSTRTWLLTASVLWLGVATVCWWPQPHLEASYPVRLSGIVPASATDALLLGQPLDLNRTTAADLELLPGIGPALAARIVAYRQTHGPFLSVGQLEAVKGIGPKLVEKLRPLVIVVPE